MSVGARLATGLVCSRTGATAPLDRAAFLSPAGAPWLVDYGLENADGEALRTAWASRAPSMWRYRELLPILDEAARVDLGEGGTPLVSLRRGAPAGVDVRVKQEAANPTGSFKDRGLSMAVNRARELGAPGLQLPSAGNAGLALAAFAAASGLPARVAVPADTPRPVVERCRAYGAEVIETPGTLVDAGVRLRQLGGEFWDLSTLKEPYRVEGKKTMGFEVAEQLGWRAPEWILYPTGGGTGIVGMDRAFRQLETLGLVTGHPRFVVVQSAGCAPIARAFAAGEEAAAPWEFPETQIWGLRVPRAIGDFLVLRVVRESGGTAVAVEDGRAEEARSRLARTTGLRFGPEGAAAFVALEDLAARGLIGRGETAVVFQTGDPANYGL